MAVYDLTVYSKTESLLYRLYPVLINYPKSEKFTLCTEIKDGIYNIMKNISLGNSVKSKRLTYLQEADGYLQVLRTLIRLSRYRKYISEGFYREIDLQLTEINKLLVGYIKSTINK